MIRRTGRRSTIAWGTVVLALATASVIVAPVVSAAYLPTQATPEAAPSDESVAAPVVRPMVFPVIGEVSYHEDFGDSRGGGTRKHAGNDIGAPKHTPAVATTDGVITTVRHSNEGNAGNMVVLTDAEGWTYTYIHLNNDTPGTDDGVNDPAFAFGPNIEVGASVTAGDVIGWVGDSGNAENSGPHLHFEIRKPDGTPVSPFLSLQSAQNWNNSPYDFLCRGEVATFTYPVTSVAAATDAGLVELKPVTPWKPSDGDPADPSAPKPAPTTKPGPGAPTANGPSAGAPAIPTAPTTPPTGGTGSDPAPTLDDTSTTIPTTVVADVADAGFRAALGDIELDIVNLAGVSLTADGSGGVLLDRTGEVQEFGSVDYQGALDDAIVTSDATSITLTSTGEGYWVTDAQGGVHAFGDAPFLGSILLDPAGPALVDLLASPGDDGYLLLLSDGSIVAEGRAESAGDVTDLEAVGGVRAVSVTGTIGSYWILSADGRVFPFGDLEFTGSPPRGSACDWTAAVGVVSSADPSAIWMVADDLQLWPFGTATQSGPPRPAVDPLSITEAAGGAE
jgi:hypothetical protein